MSDSGNPVFQLQHHLRQGGALIAARQYDAAAEHIGKALAIDPASLVALTLRDRIQMGRSGAQRPGDGPMPIAPQAKMIASSAETASRFVPSGVNAASWIDFEQRIQDRRYRALIESAGRAIATGNAVAARLAIEEARELRPEALEVVQLAGRAALLPAARPDVQASYMRSRAFRAVSMLLFGVSLLTGLDWMRSDAPPDGIEQATGSAPAFDQMSSLLFRTATSFSERYPEPGPPPVTEVPGTAGDLFEDAPPLAAGAVPVALPAAPIDGRVATTAGASTVAPVIASSGSVPDSPVPSFRRDVPDAAATRPVALLGVEIPDDYVARSSIRRDPAAARDPEATRPVSSVTGPVANVARQPGPIVDVLGAGRATPPVSPPAAPVPAPPPPAIAAVAAAAVVTPAIEEARVQSALQQYARAYGQLDARAARAIWPTVDERALAKAFAELESQQFSFDTCEIDVRGEAATASCRGTASYVGRIGSQGSRTETRQWRFDLKRDGEAWKIAKAETRR